MLIPLRRKYLAGFKSRNLAHENAAPKKRRNKLNDAAKRNLPARPRVVLVVEGMTGKSHFERSN